MRTIEEVQNELKPSQVIKEVKSINYSKKS